MNQCFLKDTIYIRHCKWKWWHCELLSNPSFPLPSYLSFPALLLSHRGKEKQRQIEKFSHLKYTLFCYSTDSFQRLLVTCLVFQNLKLERSMWFATVLCTQVITTWYSVITLLNQYFSISWSMQKPNENSKWGMRIWKKQTCLDRGQLRMWEHGRKWRSRQGYKEAFLLFHGGIAQGWRGGYILFCVVTLVPDNLTLSCVVLLCTILLKDENHILLNWTKIKCTTMLQLLPPQIFSLT